MGRTQGLGTLVQLEFGVLVALLLFLFCLKAELNIVKTPLPITALLGKNVTIPCVLTQDQGQELDLDLSIVGVRWKKIYSNRSEVDVYKFLSLGHVPIRPGSFIDERNLRRGDISLTLSHVQRSDEGEYTCTVFVTPNKALAAIDVQVFAQPDVALCVTELAVELGSERSVICQVSNYYPETVKIRWVKYSKSSGAISSSDKVTYFTVPEENSDGSFNVTSLLAVRPSSLMESGDSYSCKVTHVSLTRDKEVSFTLTVTERPTDNNLLVAIIMMTMILLLGIAVVVYFIHFRKIPPKISDIAGIEDLVHEKSCTLSWMVSEFKPKNIEINVYLDRGDRERVLLPCMTPHAHDYDDVDNPERVEECRLLQQPNAMQLQMLKSSLFSYNRLCFSIITPDKKKDKGAELVIEVKHDALKSTLTKCQRLKIKGDPFTCHIIAPQCLYHGEEVTLTCDITKCDPGALSITWKKGRQVICMDGDVQDTRYTYAEIWDEPHEEGNVLKSSSSVTFRVQFNEDHDKKYTCRVQYPAINQILVPHLKTLITAAPVVEEITCKHVGEQMELSCRIHSFHPETIEIKWFKGDEELPTSDCELITGEDGLRRTTSVLMYIPQIEDIGKTFRCQVDHQSRTPQTREWKLEGLRINGIKG